MSAQAWKFYNKAKKKIGNGTISLATTTKRIMLVTSASNFATYTISLIGSITNQVASGYGYCATPLGKALSSVLWTVGASAKQYKFAAGATKWSANGGTIANIKAAVVYVSGASAGLRHAICFASLTSSQFSLAAGNSLTVTPAATGIATLT